MAFNWLPISFAAAILVIGAMAQKSSPKIDPIKPTKRSNPVTYEINAQLVFTPPVGTKVAHVWIVKPPDDAGQELLDFETEPKPTMEAADPLYGNQLVYFRFDEPDGAQVIQYRLKIRAWELHWNLDPSKVTAYREVAMSEWLRNESRIVVNDHRIRALAQKIVNGATEPFERVKRVLEFIIDTMNYSHGECSLQASALHALTRRVGHCSDYHGFATALLRSLGIPARIVYGINPHKRHSPSHCKLEVFLHPYGWVPFDLSETDKVLEQLSKSDLPERVKAQKRDAILQWLFSGFRDNTWFRVTTGTDFPVVPAVAPNPPVIRTAYIVCDDKILPDPDPANPNRMEFAWQLVWNSKSDKPVTYPWSLWLKP
ncbi:MAG: transglutaminase domain-containing protein [Armatimonadetes bacterium]|nr:transglutaminase domain-containing protein [Armatimonadota bacterium]MDW8029100.1 transglutaminase domain-containing protein [Armatimonadota bacterium]